MSNTRQTVTLDLSGLQADSTTIAYSSFSAPALNGLLYNEAPIHYGGGVLSFLGPAVKRALPVVKSALPAVKSAFKSAAQDAATAGAQDLFSSNPFSSKKPSSPKRSP